MELNEKLDGINNMYIGDSCWCIVYDVKKRKAYPEMKDLYIPKRVSKCEISFFKVDEDKYPYRVYIFCKSKDGLRGDEKLGVTFGSITEDINEWFTNENKTIDINLNNCFYNDEDAYKAFNDECNKFIKRVPYMVKDLETHIDFLNGEVEKIKNIVEKTV